MPELIDRQAALAEIDDTIAGSLQRPEDVYIDKGLMMARTLIEKLPTIEAEPVRHGRWNYRHEDDWCYCTACGTDAEGSDGECLETDYCPKCGARMDGGADNG